MVKVGNEKKKTKEERERGRERGGEGGRESKVRQIVGSFFFFFSKFVWIGLIQPRVFFSFSYLVRIEIEENCKFSSNEEMGAELAREGREGAGEEAENKYNKDSFLSTL